MAFTKLGKMEEKGQRERPKVSGNTLRWLYPSEDAAGEHPAMSTAVQETEDIPSAGLCVGSEPPCDASGSEHSGLGFGCRACKRCVTSCDSQEG